MIRFYNTLKRKKEEFKPINPGKVGLYTCGPTVYNNAHIGNFRAYMFEDLLRRLLELSGYEVQHVMNITDIDDKTIRKANDLGVPLNTVTDKYSDIFHKDVETLFILPAHHYPKATEYVAKMIDLVKILEEKDIAYKCDDGSVFFKISNYKDYGKLSNLNPEEQKIGSRVVQDEYEKEEARDFALWKSRKVEDGNIFWDSPWGEGRPGWHLECSVMSMDLLGSHFDIHCGGVDNIFPHHENEIAQSCAAMDSEFVNVWIHNEHLLVDGQKMSKSLKNFYKIDDLLEMGYSPESIRYTLLATHYRQKLNFTFEKLKASQKAINRLREFQRRLETIRNNDGDDLKESSNEVVKEFLSTLSDDLNISGALGILFIWVNKIFAKTDIDQVSISGAKNAIDALFRIDSVLGVVECPEDFIDDEIESLITQRNEARKTKDWTRADEVRLQLDQMGILLEDTSDGTIWKKK